MSAVPEQKGLISAIAEPIAQGIAQHQASAPHEKNRTRAGLGAALIVACIYIAVWADVFLGDSFGGLIVAFFQAPLHPPVALLIWTAGVSLGLIWLWVGLRGVRGPRDVLATFWAGVRVALFSCALLWRWYLPGQDGWVLLLNLVLHGLYLALLAEAAVHFLLAVRGPRGDAAGLVARQIERASILWRTGRQRKF
jgi:hypothetical protein